MLLPKKKCIVSFKTIFRRGQFYGIFNTFFTSLFFCCFLWLLTHSRWCCCLLARCCCCWCSFIYIIFFCEEFAFIACKSMLVKWHLTVRSLIMAVSFLLLYIFCAGRKAFDKLYLCFIMVYGFKVISLKERKNGN